MAKSFKDGNSAALPKLIKLYTKRLGNETLASWWCNAEYKEDADSQYKLGSGYRGGSHGLVADKEKAFYWLSRAAENGNANAQCETGDFYYDGIVVQKDSAIAAEWYKKAAEQGDIFAQEKLGEMYADGNGVELDYDQAADLLLKVIERDKEGIFIFYRNVLQQLAEIYKKGNQVSRNKIESYVLGKITGILENKYLETQNLLWKLYRKGICIGLIDEMLLKALNKAEETPSAVLAYNIGWLYDVGISFKKDRDKALAWYKVAEGKGNRDAKMRREFLLKRNAIAQENANSK